MKLDKNVGRALLILSAFLLLLPFAAPLDLAQAATTDDQAEEGQLLPFEYIEMTLGSESAPVHVIEYASLTCPHCASFHRDVYPSIKENYIDTGKIRFGIREVYFDRLGLLASLVARCGGEEKFFEIVDLILAKQSEWTSGQNLAEVAERLGSMAKSLGISDAQYRRCISDREAAPKLVELSRDFMANDGITGTPSFIIDGKLYQNMDYGDFSGVLDDLLD